MSTTVVHIRDPHDVYIGRGVGPDGIISKWGNPFSHKMNTIARFRVQNRKEAIDKFREWIQTQPQLLAALPALKGKTLGCWCKPLACHGDVLAEMADAL